MPKIITIDGPAGSGKSTVAKGVAKRLGFTYLDTGAMYRAFTLKAIKEKIDLEDADRLIALIKKTDIKISPQPDGSLKVMLDAKDVTVQIRKPLVTKKVSFVARIPGVRREMVKLQREFGRKNNIVVEGRDIGTVVFPSAPFKFYLDASPEERARRRQAESGSGPTLAAVKSSLSRRDSIDSSRDVAPLHAARDAEIIDSTSMSIDEVVCFIVKAVLRG